MLSYDVRYHWQQKRAPLLFAEEDLEKKRRNRQDLITPAEPTSQAHKKAATKKNSEGLQVRCFEDLMDELSGLYRLVVMPQRAADKKREIVMMQQKTAIQKKAFKLLQIPLP
ncbi:MAG: hypothetical protein OXE77_09870 [Flavobacteriaceae bacterium]|nr:hypothetical protein [Flavobacteriaceae bacterium]MCY4266760.1 hypothetical protein [Flavobacteriaceae bacterium]MCY4298054.1 hypothetical protein [Flavobacteriaceae bacterium]